MKPELLSPAGNIEAAYAALYYGADALYLGLKSFSARATAENFTQDELDEITAYAHHLKRKIYVTVNTLIQEDELPELLKTLDICSKCKVDAIILQDLGVANLIKTQYPELAMHASTQMAVHNLEGALFLKSYGFSRIVLARELSLAEINNIALHSGVETEVFIHGALCYSYSGLCQFSSLEYGKSANRGKCLYPCRSCFETENGLKHLFSMKDMALEKNILSLQATSFKIEGRKKSPLYVAAVTDYYRHILDEGKENHQKAENIKQIFSRPWCHFHVTGHDKDIVDPDFVGHRGLFIGEIQNVIKGKLIFKTTHTISRFDGLQIDVEGKEKPFGFSVQKMRVNGKGVIKAEAGDIVEIELEKGYPFLNIKDKVYLASSSEVKGAYDYTKPKPHAFQNKIPVNLKIRLSKNRMIVQSEECTKIFEGTFEKASNPEKTFEALERSFQKTGETPFELKGFELENPQNLFVSASSANEYRRLFYSFLKPNYKKGMLSKLPLPQQPQKTGFAIKTDNLSCLKELDLSKFEEIIYLISESSDLEPLSDFRQEKIRIALPYVLRNPSKIKNQIISLINKGYKKWEVSNFWALEILKNHTLDIRFGSFLYTLNTQALLCAKEMGASSITFSMEDTLLNIKKLANLSFLPTTFVIYQDVPLFTSAVCIKKTDCKNCLKQKEWFELKLNKNTYEALSVPCQTMLFKKEPLCTASIAREVPAFLYQMDFCYKTYLPKEVLQITNQLMKFEDLTPSYQGNLNRLSL